jgi:tetratricopeptide (TPR) repeat protein
MPSLASTRFSSCRFAKLVFILVGIFCIGCSSQEDGSSIEDIERRLKQRQKEAVAKSGDIEERLQRALSQFADGNVSGAESQVRSILIVQPENQDAKLLAAKCAGYDGRTREAVELLDGIDAVDSERYEKALWLAAQFLIEADQYDDAEQRLKRLLLLSGDTNRVHRRLAILLNNQGRRIESAEHLRALARSGDVSPKELFAMNAYSEEFIDESLSRPDLRGKLSPAALAQARRFRSDGDLPNAEELIEKLAEAFPSSTQISAFQGRIYDELLDDGKLQQWAAKTPVGIEQEPEYWTAIGHWSQRHELHREAVRCFAEAVILDETSRVSYLGLSRSLTVLKEYELAEVASMRFQLLEESAAISKRLGRGTETGDQLNRMAYIYEQLHRPWEAKAFRALALSKQGASLGGSDASKRERDSLAQSTTPPKDEHFRACGIEVSDWPLPIFDQKTADRASGPINGDDQKSNIPIALVDVASSAELDFQYQNGDDLNDDSQYLHQMTGGGIGVCDFDLDGFVDIYFSQGGGDAFDDSGSQPNQLFRNIDGKRFVNVSESAKVGDLGYGQGVAFADLNQDGFADIAVANIGVNCLYVNNGDGTFRCERLPTKSDGGSWTTSLACGDISGDHLPEIVEVNYIDDPTAFLIACTPKHDVCNPSVFRPAADCVWSVGADGKITSWNGLEDGASHPSYGFAAVIANFDSKAGNDVYIANDTDINHFWVSQMAEDGAGFVLSESAQVLGCATGVLGQRQGSMGIAYGDFDHNACLDMYVTNFWNQAPDLYLQQGTGLFVNGSSKYALYEPGRRTVAWGAQAVDFDRNGWLDIAVLNGHLVDHQHLGQPYEMLPQLFCGYEGAFQMFVPSGDGDNFWKSPTLGRTLAVLDWNNDHKPDLVANHLDAPVALLENQTRSENSVQLDLVGVTSERDAIGATVTIYCGNQKWTHWVTGGDGLLCTNEQVIDFGIGQNRRVDRVEISWPSGLRQQFSELEANRRYLLIEGEIKPHDRA